MKAKNTAVPKVSVVAVAYNQEKYIRQTIESFLAQKTNFSFEIIIADDCSTDETAQIIKEYAKANPETIRPILREKNIGVTQNFIQTLRVAKGQYIALCEGDDFWTDSSKLQRQIDFLDSHPEYALCFHPVRVFFENAKEEDEYIYPEAKTNFTVHKLLKENFIQTNSVVYRKQKYTNMPDNILPIDWYLHLYHAQFGKIGFVNRVMSAYRRHPGGVWWNAYHNKNKFWEKYSLPHFRLFLEVFKLYGNDKDYRDVIYFSMGNICYELQEVDNKHGTKLLKELLIKFPDTIGPLIAQQHKNIQTAQKLKSNDAHEVKLLKQIIKLKEDHIKKLDAQSYQMLEEISRIKKQPIRSVAQKYLRRNDKLKH